MRGHKFDCVNAGARPGKLGVQKHLLEKDPSSAMYVDNMHPQSKEASEDYSGSLNSQTDQINSIKPVVSICITTSTSKGVPQLA